MSRAEALHYWLVDQRSAGHHVLSDGAASHAVALLWCAGVDRSLPSPMRRLPSTPAPCQGRTSR